jgi:hypothetical protein
MNPGSTPKLKIDDFFYPKTNASKMKISKNQWMVFEKPMDAFSEKSCIKNFILLCIRTRPVPHTIRVELCIDPKIHPVHTFAAAITYDIDVLQMAL